MPNGEKEGLFRKHKDLFPWNEVQQVYEHRYPAAEFWAWLQQGLPEGFKIPEYTLGIAREALLESYLGRAYETWEGAFRPSEAPERVPKPWWFLGSQAEWQADPRSQEFVKIAEGVWEKVTPVGPPTTGEEWVERMTSTEKADLDRVMGFYAARYGVITPGMPMELPEDVRTALNEYIFTIMQQAEKLITEEMVNQELEKRGYITEEQKATVTDEMKDTLTEELLWEKVRTGEMVVEIPAEAKPLIQKIVDEATYIDEVAAMRRVIPEPYRVFVDKNFPDLPAELTNLLYRTSTREVRQAKQSALIQGRALTDAEALATLSEDAISKIERQGVASWLQVTPEEPGVLPMVQPAQTLFRAAKYTGMTPIQYIQSTFQDYKVHLPSEYVAGKSNEDLMSEFIRGFGPLGERSSLLGYVESDLITAGEAVGAERQAIRERLTPLYEPVTAPWGVPGEKLWGVPEEKAAVPTGAFQVAAEQPAGERAEGGPPMREITQAEAKTGYIRELKRRGYGPEDIGYLQQFFPSLFPFTWPRMTEPKEFAKYIKALDIPSPPRREQPKTRFVRRI